MTSIRTSAVIDPDGAITVNVPDLRLGQVVEVTIEVPGAVSASSKVQPQ